MKIFIAIALLGVLVAPTESRKLHGLAAERDWSKTAHQFNLQRHLKTPTTRDLLDGVENSRRLARNAIRTGTDEQFHRELVPGNPPSGIIEEFDQNTPPVSQGPRVPISGGTTDALPFGEGPGVFPAFPEGTVDFWSSGGSPTKMWEVVACPVADVDAFLSNPLRCVFGVNENGVPDSGSLMDFFSSVGDAAIDAVMDEAIIPLAAEAIWTFSGLGWLEKIFSTVCTILGIVDAIIGIVESIGGGLSDLAGDVADAFTSCFGLCRRLQVGEEFASCQGHYAICNDDTLIDCDECLLDATGTDCGSCRTCWQPLHLSNADMDGLCIQTDELRDFVTSEAVPFYTVQGLYSSMLANYMKKVGSEDVIDAVITALGVDVGNGETLVAKITSAQTEIIGNTDTAETTITAAITSAQGALFTKIEETCPAPTTRRRLREQDKKEVFDEFLQSKQAKNAKEFAAKKGLDDSSIDEIFSKLLNGLSGEAGNAFDNDVFEDKIKETLKDPEQLLQLEKLLQADTDANGDKHATKLASKLIKSTVDPKTRRLDANKLKDIQAKLVEIKNNRRSLGALEDGCNTLLAEIKTFIKDEIITPLLQGLLTGLEAALGASNTAFSAVEGNQIYQDALGGIADVAGSSLLMGFGLVSVMDPWTAGGAFQLVMGVVVDIFQIIVCLFLFGGNGGSCNGALPSEVNDVLPIKEDRNGQIFMASGCDSEFEGELAWYKPAHEILSNLLNEAGKSIIEFINIPINVIKFILDAAAKLFDHMDNVCGYLDGYVQLALVEATHENSRYALHELACRDPAIALLPLQRGYGCDGLDNDCDANKEIDECEEDIFPPDVDAAAAILKCGDETFKDEAEAIACFAGLVTATDDCKEVETTITAMGTTACSSSIVITAVAQGCGGRVPEDTTVLETAVKLDNEDPVVTCQLLTQGLNGNGAGVFTDLQFRFTAVDGGGGCTSNEDLQVKIEVFSNEVVETGEQMVSVSTPLDPGDIPFIFAENHTCNNANNGKCKISSAKQSREYFVRVSATDEAGNVGEGTCHTWVGPEEAGDPRFLLTELEIVGGNNPPVL